MITIETADNALKTFYLDAVTEALDLKANPLLAQIQRSTADVVGKDVRKLVKYGVNGGISAGSETGDLPTAAESDRVQFISTLKNLYGTIEISDKALRASANNEGAFVNLLNDEMQSLIKSAAFNFGRMLYGDGSGRLAVVEEVADDNHVYLSDVKGLVEGMLVDFATENDVIISGATARKVLSVDRAEKCVVFDGADLMENVPIDCYVYLHDCKGYELTGLKALFGDGELYGVDRTSSPMMKPYKKTGVGAISENVIQKAIDTIEENSGSQVNFIVCSWGVKRALAEYFRQFTTVMPTIEFAGGFKAVSFNGIPVVADRFCPDGTMYLLNTDDFKIHQLCDWKWLEGEDGKILKQIPGKPVYTATLVKYAELMCDRPNGQGVLEGITEA
ncbi:MAG: phage major capsid protein [Clostridia bacterium]|nr:phage major capsid protein [Clostridia bacterium]